MRLPHSGEMPPVGVQQGRERAGAQAVDHPRGETDRLVLMPARRQRAHRHERHEGGEQNAERLRAERDEAAQAPGSRSARVERLQHRHEQDQADALGQRRSQHEREDQRHASRAGEAEHHAPGACCNLHRANSSRAIRDGGNSAYVEMSPPVTTRSPTLSQACA